MSALKPIPGYDGYFVSVSGRVLSTRKGSPKYLKSYINSNGYRTVKTAKGHLFIHRAIALAYLPLVEGRTEVNHKDGNKQNNDVHNLEWTTRGDNVLHAMRNGLHSNRETPICGVEEGTGNGLWLVSQAKARKYGFTQSNVNKCLKGLRPNHKGYTWSYA